MGAFDRLKNNLANKRGARFLRKDAFTSKDLTDSAQLIATMGDTSIPRSGFLDKISTKGITTTMDDATASLKACVDTLYAALEATIVRDATAISRAVASLSDNGTTSKAGANTNGAIFITIAADLRSMYMDTSIAFRNFDADLKMAKATSDRFSLLKASSGRGVRFTGKAQTKSTKDLNEIVEKISLLGDKVTFEQVFKPYEDYRSSALYQAGTELAGIGAAGANANKVALAYTLFAMKAILGSLEHMLKTVELATLLDTPRARAQEGFLIARLIEISDNIRLRLDAMLDKSEGAVPYSGAVPGSPEDNVKDDIGTARGTLSLTPPVTTKEGLKNVITRLEKSVLAKAGARHPTGMNYGDHAPANAEETLKKISDDHKLVASTIKPPWKFSP